MTDPALSFEGPATVVFDFDGTLVAGDCGRAYIHWLLRRNPLRFLAALLAAPVAMPMLSLRPTRKAAISVFLWLGTVGLRGAALEQRTARFVADYPLSPVRDAAAALREEYSRGHRVVVATGALRALADGLLRRLGLREQVSLVASEGRRFAGGLVVGVQCNGVEKVRHLHAQGFPGPYLRAYSDSASDRPLLGSALTPVLVNALAGDRKRLRRRFGGRLRVVAWT